ncbi:MAG TPA: SAVMC3_10250 family protein [Pseudonocardia sp.]|nr:SAVMC3_10250 family protein [Pseudonocardia sp.]
MAERIYLSQRRLADFRDGTANQGFLRQVHVAEAAAPVASGRGGAPTHELRQEQNAALRQVVANVERSARSFDAKDVTPGEWVHFRTPLTSASIDLGEWGHERLAGMELMVYWTPDELSTGLERLVLLAQPEGLLDDEYWPYELHRPASTREHLLGLLPSLSELAQTHGEIAADVAGRMPILEELALLDQARAESEYEAPRIHSGYARVLANIAERSWGRARARSRRAIVASPLYVEQ